MPIQTALDSIGNNQGSPFGFKNRIINGAMTFDQRYSGSSYTVVGDVHTLDRWKVFQTATSKFSVQQNAGSVTPPVGFSNYLGVTSLSSYSVGSSDYFLLNQAIEGYNVADLAWGTTNAKPVTVSFWVRSSLTGTFGGSISSENWTRAYAYTYTISSANTWEKKTVTIPGETSGSWNTTTGNGMNIRFVLGCGSTRLTSTIGSWVSSGYDGPSGSTSIVGTNGATWYITGVQVEKGSSSTEFDWRPYAYEQFLCKRYYQRVEANIPLPMSTQPNIPTSQYNGVSYIGLPVTMRPGASASMTAGTSNYSWAEGGNARTSIAGFQNASDGSQLSIWTNGTLNSNECRTLSFTQPIICSSEI